MYRPGTGMFVSPVPRPVDAMGFGFIQAALNARHGEKLEQRLNFCVIKQ